MKIKMKMKKDKDEISNYVVLLTVLVKRLGVSRVRDFFLYE